MKLESNAPMQMASTRLLESSLMIHIFGFTVFNVNRLVDTLRKGIQS